eukprot:259601_1
MARTLFLSYLLFSLYLDSCISITWSNDNGTFMIPIYGSSYATINDTVYMFGGDDTDFQTDTNKVQTYTISTGLSTILSITTPEPASCGGQCATTISDSEILIIGAVNIHHGTVWKFDAIKGSFVNHSIPEEPNKVWSPCITYNADDNVVYVVGGLNEIFTALGIIQILNLNTNQWSVGATS